MVSEAKKELLVNILNDIEQLSDKEKKPLSRLVTNYKRQLFVHENIIKDSLKCIEKLYPPIEDV